MTLARGGIATAVIAALLALAATLVGSAGADSRAGQPGGKCRGQEPTIVGKKGDDAHLKGTRRRDIILARGGIDFIDARGGRDLICAGSGNDFVAPGTNDDKVYGDNGHDILLGQGGNDKLFGRDGDDRMDGQKGRDSCEGGPGADVGSEAGCERLRSATGV